MSLNIDTIKSFMTGLQENYKPERNFVMYTGQAGYNAFNESIALIIDKQNNIDMVHFLHEKKILDDEQKNTILAMIESGDQENYNLAKLLLERKAKELKS